jgi:conjugal transfer ATP-binding protein TraC
MPIFAKISDFFYGKNGGFKLKELFKMSERDKLSDYLPWIAYDEETRLYYLADDNYGFMWECSPLFFSSASTVNVTSGLLNIMLPESTVMQVILYADPDTEFILNRHVQTKKRQSKLISMVNENLTDFYREGRRGIPNMGKIPSRNFRLFITVKFPEKELKNMEINHVWHTMTELLKGAHLLPRPVEPAILIDWARSYFNETPSANNFHYDDTIPIRKQVLFATHTESFLSYIKLDSRIFRCMTPKAHPPEIGPLQVNSLFGGIDGVISDESQISSPFLFTLTILFENQKNRIHAKCNMILRQQAVGSYAPSLVRKRDEHLWATDELEKGTKFLRIIPSFWVFGSDERKVSESLIRAKRIWEWQGFVMQEDKGVLLPLFLSSLPFGLYNIGTNVNLLDRHYIAPTDTIAAYFPIQGDFCGAGDPVMLFSGRKGQLFGVDIFCKGANNHNVFVAATAGAGKSFFVNYAVYNYYTAGNLIRIIDIGGSYKKATLLFDAKYMDFSENSNVKLNPFTNLTDPEFDIPVITPIVAQMAFSAGASSPTESEMTLIKMAIRWAYEQEGSDAGIDTVHRFLSDYDQMEKTNSQEILESARKLSFNLVNFTSGNAYGKYFNGPSNFDIQHDEFVVLELEHLIQRADLFRVVTMQVVNNVTQDLYLSDRSRKRMVFFDEAYQFLGKTSHIKDVIEIGYRRARKYGGSFWVITQSLLDTLQWENAGSVIMNNSNFKFYLESTDYEKAHKEKLIDYDEFTMDLLKNLKSNAPNYSEIFMDTSFGMGVGRLIVDPFSYYVFTSSPKEVSEIEQMVKGGMDYAEAMGNMVQKYRS